MIEIKKIGSALNLNKTTVLIEDTELNAGNQSALYNFTGTPILFITIQNNAGVNFNNFYLLDAVGRSITHHSQVNDTAYSIAFSGNASGAPLQLPTLTDLNAVTINWNFGGLSVGTVIVNIYTFAI
jgi:hypothetical protein